MRALTPQEGRPLGQVPSGREGQGPLPRCSRPLLLARRALWGGTACPRPHTASSHRGPGRPYTGMSPVQVAVCGRAPHRGGGGLGFWPRPGVLPAALCPRPRPRVLTPFVPRQGFLGSPADVPECVIPSPSGQLAEAGSCLQLQLLPRPHSVQTPGLRTQRAAAAWPAGRGSGGQRSPLPVHLGHFPALRFAPAPPLTPARKGRRWSQTSASPPDPGHGASQKRRQAPRMCPRPPLQPSRGPACSSRRRSRGRPPPEPPCGPQRWGWSQTIGVGGSRPGVGGFWVLGSVPSPTPPVPSPGLSVTWHGVASLSVSPTAAVWWPAL